MSYDLANTFFNPNKLTSMKKVYYIYFSVLALLLGWQQFGQAQASQITPTNGCVNCSTTIDQSAVFEIQSTDKGLLIPRMTTAQRDAIILSLIHI